MDHWVIFDDKGVIYDGSEEYVTGIWSMIEKGLEEVTWTGDLRLAEIHAIRR